MAQIAQDSAAIKEAVREHYGSRIQASSCCGPSASSNCCGSDCATPTEVALYGVETLATLPADVTTTSFGCGNPIALANLKAGELFLISDLVEGLMYCSRPSASGRRVMFTGLI